MMVPNPRLLELANIIVTNTTNIYNHLSENDLPLPSFDTDAPMRLSLSPEQEVARAAVLDATTELGELLMNPMERLADSQYNRLVSMHAITQYKIPLLVPVDGETTFAEIAQNINLDEPIVRRLLRQAMSQHVFKEPRKGVVAHTATSKILADDPAMLDWLATGCEELWPSAVKTIPAIVKWPNSQEPSQSGYSLANNTDESAYNEMAKNPARAKRFAKAMSAFTAGPGYELKHIVDHGPWQSLGSGLMVDCGGSHGDAVIAIAEKYPNPRFIVQDIRETIETHPPLPTSLENRITYMVHDIFKEQPVKDADVYYFRWVFHNWPNKYCIKILQNLIPALKNGAKVIINEWCLPEPNSSTIRMEKRIRAMDVSMMQLQNSQEREKDEWIALLKDADSRFELTGIKSPKGSNLSIIEATWKADHE